MEENNNNLFIFSFKLLLFIALFVIVIQLFFIPYVPNLGEDNKYLQSLNEVKSVEKKYDMIFFGNSYSYTAYDPTIIINELGLSSLHINSPSQILEVSLVIANDIIEKEGLKYVFFDISEPSLLRPKNDKEKSWYYQTIALQEIQFSFSKFIQTSKIFPIKVYPEYYISSLSKKVGRIFRMNKREEYKVHIPEFKYPDEKGSLFYLDGYFARDSKKKSLTKELFQIENSKKPKQTIGNKSLWNKELRNQVERFILKCKNKGVQVIFINSLKLRTQEFSVDYLGGLVAKFKNLKVLNLNASRAIYNLNEHTFFDSGHLNYQGSYQVSHRLVDSLSSWYSLDKKRKIVKNMKLLELKDVYYHLQEGQNKFIKLEFDKIPKLLNGHQLVISIYPKDTKLLSDYSKKKKFGSDNFYVQQPADNNIDVGNSKIIISKLKTKITEENLKKIAIYFYKPKDALGMPTINIFKD